tara:strand:+ start:498 stop:776 length:279 start_codon:yes stop_codon:yes gene_type:complete
MSTESFATDFWRKFSQSMDAQVVQLVYDALMAFRQNLMSEVQCDLCIRYVLIHTNELYNEYCALMAQRHPSDTWSMSAPLHLDASFDRPRIP